MSDNKDSKNPASPSKKDEKDKNGKDGKNKGKGKDAHKEEELVYIVKHAN
jgi:hypothetical protein